MKKEIVLFLWVVLSQHIFSQEQNFTLDTKQLIDSRDLYINSGARAQFEGKSRTYIKIDLPPNTEYWYYSFSTSKGNRGVKNLNLAIQLAGFLVDPSGISSKTLTAIEVPEGEATVDVYVLNRQNLISFLGKNSFQHFSEGMAENTKQAVVRIDDVKTGTWYLAIKNPSSLNGIQIRIEVVAVLKKTVKKIKTKKQEKAELYGSLGWTKFLNNEYDQCIEYCNKSDELYPLGWVQFNKGLATLVLGKETEAIEIYINALLLVKDDAHKVYYLNEALKDINKIRDLHLNLKWVEEIKKMIYGQL